MQEEKEIKIEILNKKINFASLRRKIEDLYKIKFVKNSYSQDYYYDDYKNRFFNLNHAIRIRRSDKGASLCYKALFKVPQRTENPWFVLEKELGFPISKKNFIEFANLISLDLNILDLPEKIEEGLIDGFFNQIGLRQTITINKSRLESSKENGFHVILDRVEKLGTFVEVEAEEDDLLKEFISKFPFLNREIRYGYTNLYAERVLGLHIPDFNKKYQQNPNWNYLNSQKKIVKDLMSKN